MKYVSRSQSEQHRYFRKLQKATEIQLDRQLTIRTREIVCDLLEHLDEVEDYRSRKCQYPIELILTLIVLGCMMGENTIANIENVLKANCGRVRDWLGMTREELPTMPSDSTMLRALHGCRSLDVMVVFVEWIERHFTGELKTEHVAVDGKATRGSSDKIRGQEYPDYLLNAFSVTHGVISMQFTVGRKTNELGCMPQLFEVMDLAGVTITIDAAGTHSNIMKIITSAGGHAVLPVKGNQSNLEATLSEFIRDVTENHPDWIFAHDDVDNGKYQHGRVENRHYILIHNGVDDVLKGTPFEDLGHSVGMVTRTVEQVKKDDAGNILDIEPTTVFQIYITDYRDLPVEKFANYVRDHWKGCETMHYILDMEFDEDHSRIRGDNARATSSLIRKVTLSFLKYIKQESKTRKSCHDIRRTFAFTFGIEAPYSIPNQASA